jgi:hypothetical protein
MKRKEQGTNDYVRYHEKRRIVEYPLDIENMIRGRSTGTYLARPPGDKQDN